MVRQGFVRIRISSEAPLPDRTPRRRAVIALGGNAITQPGQEGTVEQDYANLERSLEGVLTVSTAATSWCSPTATDRRSATR